METPGRPVTFQARCDIHDAHGANNLAIDEQLRLVELEGWSRQYRGLHVSEMKPGFVKTTAARSEDEISYIAKFMLRLTDTPAADYIDAVQGAERLKDGYAESTSRSTTYRYG
jgi:hypothetical protein